MGKANGNKGREENEGVITPRSIYSEEFTFLNKMETRKVQ